MDFYGEASAKNDGYKVPSGNPTSPHASLTPPTFHSPDQDSGGQASSKTADPFNHEAGSPSTSAVPRIRRRNRMITSCLECRRRKLKCNKAHPCSNCQKFQRDCVFIAPALDQASQLKLQEIKEKVGSLERLLERDVAKTNAAESQGISQDDMDENPPPREDEKDLEPTPLAVEDAAYEEIDGDDDEFLDLGVSLGKMRINERLGGFFRPRISQELEYVYSKGPLAEIKEEDPIAFEPLPPAHEWLKPGPFYIAPSSGFFFGQQMSKGALLDFLPSRDLGNKLIRQYFHAVHPIALILHRPSFEKTWMSFWEEVALGIEPPTSAQAIVFATMFSGVVSMSDGQISREFGVAKATLVDNFKIGVETALARANFLRTTRLDTLQAFVSYLIPLCRAEISRSHSVLVGAAIRMAECMGLHRDGETYGLNHLETHVRRLIWYQLCWLDIRTCEAQGPKPSIRKDDFDVRMPLNVDDIDIRATGPPPTSSDIWTDSTATVMRFELTEMNRVVWVDRYLIQRRKMSVGAALAKVEKFRKYMLKYDNMIDDRVPLQRWNKIVKQLLIARLYVVVLHLFHTSVKNPMPQRLADILIRSGTQSLELGMSIDTNPDFAPWQWYTGALQQYQSAFLLIMEIYVKPTRSEADRIWRCLDFVFECSPSEPRTHKARRLLSELQRKTAIYQTMRGVRAPKHMDQHIENKMPRSTQNTTLPPLVSPMMGQLPVIPGADVIFGGVSNGESLWALPNTQSPESNPGANTQQGKPLPMGDGLGQDDMMTDIDWDAFDALFPPDQQLDPSFMLY